MSHNVQIKGVKINNLDALESALSELRREGVNCRLVRGTPGARGLRFRVYGSGYNNPMADHVIELPGCSYDIGLIQQEGGHYEAVCDNALGISVKCPLAAEYPTTAGFNYRVITSKEELEAAGKGIAIGKLMQRYSAIVTERDARLRGYRSQRVTTPNGGLQVIINV